MVLVFAHQDNPRLRYVLNEVFTRRLGLEVSVQTDSAAFSSAKVEAKLAYCPNRLKGDGVWVSPSGLLSKGAAIFPELRSVNGLTLLFPSGGDLGFDPLSMAFWCLSRMEEYGQVKRDMHGRYAAKNSLLYGCLEEPVLDQALLLLYEALGLSAKPRFWVQPSVDIDIAYQFKARSLGRAIGAAIRQPQFTKRRIKALAGGPDPHDPLLTVLPVVQEQPYTRVFLLASKRVNRYNKQVRRKNENFQACVKALAQTGQLGLHPSLRNHNAANLWAEEKAWIESHSPGSLTSSRQHYIHLSFPGTYRHLIGLGIKEDYSMGYPDLPGFRAGTAYPFAWYDLEREELTELTLHPFCLMDVMCRNYQKLSAEDSLGLGQVLRERVKASGGEFGFIFHNESLSDTGPWKGWKRVFDAWSQHG